MALLTERAIKRHPVAVITVESQVQDVAKGGHPADFEWFKTIDAAQEWMTQWTTHAKEDVAAYSVIGGEEPALAYLTILMSDTDLLTLTDSNVVPVNAATKAWLDETLADITTLFDKPEVKVKKKVVVKARKRVVAKSTATDEPDEDIVTKLRVRPRRTVVKSTESE